MVEEFIKYTDDNKLIKKTDRILLAVSGGIDSMVMAHLFISINKQIGIAHCNFNLRGRDSDEDESFVRDFAASHKIPFFYEKFDTSGYASEKNISIQMAARELRYKWFEEIRVKNSYDSVSLAHNLNDNIETFLINLIRGTGIAGLTGMKPKHKKLIRPLLFATRNAIEEYRTLNDIPFREDKSNAETKYIRNKIRHYVLPVLKEINPSIETTLNETAERLGEINDIVAGVISDTRDNISGQKNNLVTFRTGDLNLLSPKRTILFELFRPFGIGNGQMDDLVNLINGKTGGLVFTRTHRLIKNRKEILVTPMEFDTENCFEISRIEDFQKVPAVISASITEVNDGFIIPDSSNIACLDAGKISYPVIIRRWMPGDAFYPLGMRQKKKLSDHFIDNKYSLLDKEHCRILESKGRIVWVIGDRIDNRFKISKSSKKALVIHVKQAQTDT